MKKYILCLTIAFMTLLGNSSSFASISNHYTMLGSTPKDTTIVYFIEGISSEGTEATVRYTNGKMSFAKIILCGDMGQIRIEYIFMKDRIGVCEKVYSYTKPISGIDNKLFEEYELKYFIDYKGKRIQLYIEIPYTDVYTEFVKVVPFNIDN